MKINFLPKPTISEQLDQQGIKYDPEFIKNCQDDHMRVVHLRFGKNILITESEETKIYDRLFKKIQEHVTTFDKKRTCE